MASYSLKVRRYQPESGDGPYWETFDVDLDPTLSVLDGLLQARDRDDGSLSVRCSCRAAICGSCGMKINGQSGLACKTQLGEAAAEAARMSRSADGPVDGGAEPEATRNELVRGDESGEAFRRRASEPPEGYRLLGVR